MRIERLGDCPRGSRHEVGPRRNLLQFDISELPQNSEEVRVRTSNSLASSLAVDQNLVLSRIERDAAAKNPAHPSRAGELRMLDLHGERAPVATGQMPEPQDDHCIDEARELNSASALYRWKRPG